MIEYEIRRESGIPVGWDSKLEKAQELLAYYANKEKGQEFSLFKIEYVQSECVADV